MKIGILTFHRGPNYGGFLQAWHLRNAITRLGHDAEVINYQNPTLHEIEQPRLRSLHPARIRHTWRAIEKAKPFLALADSQSSHPFTMDASQIEWGKYDKIVVGSDVVWDFQSPHFGQDPAYFGMHEAQKSSRFISYAASCGPASTNGHIPTWVQQGLGKFEELGVRDENTYGLAKNYSLLEPLLVVDPTWLEDDPEVVHSLAPKRPYILVYGDALNNVRASALRRHCQSRGILLLGAGSAWKYCDKTLNGITPFEWVDLFARAQAIVTCTLHGLLYSIKKQKPFLMVTTAASSSKSKTVLDHTEAWNRTVDEQSPFHESHLDLLSSSSAPPPVPDAEWVASSRDFLAKALSA